MEIKNISGWNLELHSKKKENLSVSPHLETQQNIMIFKKVLPSKENVMHNCTKKGEITSSNDSPALEHLMLISQAPSRLVTRETIALN